MTTPIQFARVAPALAIPEADTYKWEIQHPSGYWAEFFPGCYDVRVRACNENGCGEPSPAACIEFVPEPPIALALPVLLVALYLLNRLRARAEVNHDVER